MRALLLVPAAGSPAIAASTLVHTTGTGTSGADAYIFGPNPGAPNDPDDNWGGEELLVIKNDEGPFFSHTRKSYIRFDVGSLPPLSILSAELTLTAVQSSPNNGVTYDFDIHGLVDGHAGEAWVEGSSETAVTGSSPPNPITWLNAPGNDTASGGVLPGATVLIDTFQILNSLADGQVVVSSTDALRDFIAADTDGQVTFIVTRQATGVAEQDSFGHYFAAKEHPTLDPPSLAVTVVPEPSLLAFLTIAPACLLRRRSR